MANGILIDVGFTSDVKSYIEELEREFKKIDFGGTIGLSEAFDAQIKDAEEKIIELKKEIQKIGEGRLFDQDLQKAFNTLTKSVQTLQEQFKVLVQTAPKNKQAGLLGQLSKISAGLQDVAEVTKNTSNVFDSIQNKKVINKEQLQSIAALYKELERARQASEKFDKTRKKSGNTAYSDTDEILTDLRAQYELYLDLDNELAKIQDKDKLTKKDEIQIAKLNAQITDAITNVQRLINTMAGMNEKWGRIKVFENDPNSRLDDISQEMSRTLTSMLDYIAQKKVQLQKEFTELGGDDLAAQFKQSTNKRDRITLPVVIAPGSEKKVLDECIALVTKISQELENTPIKATVQLVTKYQSEKNEALIKDLQKQIVAIEAEARNAVAEGASESEAAKLTELSNNMSDLLKRLNKQIDNAMLFTVRVNVGVAQNVVRSFVANAKAKLKELEKNPPDIEPGFTITEKVKKQFLRDINIFIAETNKQIDKLQVEKSKIGNDIFSTYINQLKGAIKELKDLKNVLNDKNLIKKGLSENVKEFEKVINDISENIENIYAGITETFNPDNLNDWATKLLSTLDEAIKKAQEIKPSLSSVQEKTTDNTIFNDNDKKKIKKITDTLVAYNKARYEYEHLFNRDLTSGFGEFYDKELIELPKSLREKLEKGLITEDEIAEIYANKYNNAFKKLSKLLPNIDVDNIDTVVNDIFNSSVFKNIEEASEELYKALSKNLDISSIIRQKVSKSNLNSFLDEINSIKQAYSDGSWRNNFAMNPFPDYQHYSNALINGDNYGLEPEDLNIYLSNIKELLPLINKAYEDINGKPIEFSEEQKNILEQLKNEELTLEEILSLWNKLNIQVEKGVLLKGNKVASQTVLGDLSNVSFEQLNNIENSIYSKFDTILHSHADGLGTFSPEDIQLVLDNWKAGVRKLLLLVDGELQEIDFSSTNKTLVTKFQKEFTSSFQKALDESFNNGNNPLNDNALFAKIKGNVFNSLLSYYGFNLTTHKIQTAIDNTGKSNPFTEQKNKVENGLDDIKNKISDSIKQLYEELYKVLDPKNIDPWAEKLLNTLNEATDKIRNLFAKNGGINELSLFLDDIAYSDKLKQTLEDNASTLEHGGILLKNGKAIGLTSTDKHGTTRYSNPYNHLDNGISEEDILSSVHTHSGDFLWMPSKDDLQNAINRELDYAITATASEIATFNVDQYKKDKISDIIDFKKLDEYVHKITNKDLSDSVKKLFNNNIDLITKSDKYLFLKMASPIKNASDLTNKEFLNEAFKQSYESKPQSEADFWNKIIKLLGIDQVYSKTDQQYKYLDELTEHVFHFNSNPNMPKHSRSAYLLSYRDKMQQYFADKGVDFNKYFAIQSHEDFKNHAAFGLDKILNQSDSEFNLGGFADAINAINENITKLGNLNISDNLNLKVDAQILNDIKASLDQIVQLLQTLPNIVGNISLTPFDTQINKLKSDLLGLESSGKGEGDKEYDDLVKQLDEIQKKRQTYINQLIKSAASTETKKDNKKTTEEEQLQKATENYNKYNKNIQKRFNEMLQKNGQELVEATFEPTKKGLIEITALIKDADDKYKSLIYTTKTGLGKNPFTLEKTKEGFSVDKVGAAYEKWLEVQEELKKDPQMIGDITPNTTAWDQLVQLAEKFGLEMKDIDRIVRNVDHGVESFQFYDKAGNRTTLGINSENELFQRQYIIQLKKDVQDFKKEVGDLPKLFQQGITNYDSNASIKYIDNLKEILNLRQRIEEYKNIGNLSDEEYNNLKALFDNTSLTIQNIVGAKISTNGKTDNFINEVTNTTSALETFLKDITSMSTQDAQTQLDALINKFRELYKTQNEPINKVAKETASTKLLAKIGDELTRNSSMSQKYKDELNALVQEMQELGKSIPQDKMNEFTNRFQDIVSRIRLAGQSGKGLFDNMSQSITKSIAQFTNMYLSVYRLIGYIKQGITQVENLDKALTTISYTMDITNTQLKDMGDNIVAMAKDLSISVENVSQIYQIYANMQTTAEEMMKTARPTAILANLSGVDASTAADQIQGVLNQFDLLAEDSMHIVDVYDKISSNISVDYSKGIAGMSDAVRNVGNVAKDAGLSFEQLSAIIGKVMERTRQDGSSIGNALRTIFVRISKASKLAGDEVDNATIGNAAKALHNIGIEVYTTEGEFREFDVIMGELAAKWDKLSDAQQANISFQIAATRQTSMLRAVLAEYTDAMNLATEATITEGNALENNQKYEDSILGKTQALKNEFSQFWIDTISSEEIKKVLDELTNLINSLNDANSTAGIFVSTITTLLEQLLKIVNVINKVPGGTLGLLFGLTVGKNRFANINPNGGVNVGVGGFNKTLFSGLAKRAYTDNDLALFNQYVASGATDATYLLGMSKAASNLVTSYDNIIDKSDELRYKLANEKQTTKALTAARTALNMAMSIGLSIVISTVIQEIDKLVHSEETLIQTSKNVANEIKQFNKSIDSYKTKIIELNKKLKDNNISVEEAYQYHSELIDLKKELLDMLKDEADAYDIITEAINGNIDALDEKAKAQRKDKIAQYDKDNQVPVITEDKDDSGWDWFWYLLGKSGKTNETTAKVMSHTIGGNLGKSASQFAYEQWLKGNDEYEEIGSEVFITKYEELYDTLSDLQKDYVQKLKNGELTEELKQTLFNQFNSILDPYDRFNPQVAKKLRSYFFKELDGASKEFVKDVQNAEAESQRIREAIQQFFEESVMGLDENGNPKSDRKFEKWGWKFLGAHNQDEAQQAFDKLGIDTQEEFDIFKQVFDEYTKNSNELGQKIAKEVLSNYSKGGNVNLLNRTEINSEELTKKLWENVGEGFATVYSSTFSNQDFTEDVINPENLIAINFTPIIEDPETGEYLGVLTPDELTEYAKGVIEGTRTDDLNLQIGAAFTGENAIKNADWVAQNIHELHEQLHYDEEKTVDGLFDLYEQRINEFKPKYKQYSDWLKQQSGVQDSSGKYYTNNDLISAYENSLKGFSEYIKNNREGQVEIDFGKIVSFTATDELFQQLDMSPFEEYTKKFGENEQAIIRYIEDIEDKLLYGTDKDGNKYLNMESTDKNQILRTLNLIKTEAMGGSNNVDKIEDSYFDLKKQLKKVRDEEKFSEVEMAKLITKYPELKDAVIKYADDAYSFQEEALDNLIGDYAGVSNAAISAQIVQTENALKAALAYANLGMTIDEVAKTYNKFYQNRNLEELHYQKIFGVNTDQIVEYYTDWEALKEKLKNIDPDDLNKKSDNKSQFDWLDSYLDKRARKINNLTSAYDRLNKQVIKSGDIEQQYYQNLNKNLDETVGALNNEIDALKTANKERNDRISKGGYLYKELVKAFGDESKAQSVIDQVKKQYEAEGIYSLEEYTSDQQSAISAIMTDYTDMLDAEQKILEDEATISEKTLQKFTNDIEFITKQYDHVLNEFANRQAELEHYQTMRTNAGMMENQQANILMLDNESRKLAANIAKRDELIAQLKELDVTSEDSLEKWWDTKDAIVDTTKAIYENQEAIESLQMSMKQLSWDLNDKIRDITGNLRNETDFLIDTLGTFEKDMYEYNREYLGNDAEKTKIYNGQMSAEGLSTLALRRTRAKSFREDIEAINKEIAEAEQDYLSNTANTTVLDRLTELHDMRNDLIQSYNDEREAIVALVKDGYDKQLQSLEAITSKTMEQLQLEKDLFNYQRNVAKQTKNLANIRKQIAAYQGDSSEEARAKLQSLQVSLEEAEESLADTQYERQLSDQQRIFDHLYQALEDYFNDQLEQPEKLLKSTESLVNDNIPTIKQTLEKSLDFYGTDLSESLKNILNENGLKGVKENIASVDGDIQAIESSVTDKTTELEQYYADYHLEAQSEKALKGRMQLLYGEGKGSFVDYFNQFNTKLDAINTTIENADSLTHLGNTVADAAGNLFQGGKSILIAASTQKSVTEKITNKVNSFKSGNIPILGNIFSHAKGKKHLTNDEIAWTQENGLEAILRPTDNAILTPLKAGDSVLTSEATKNLWDFANNPLAYIKSAVLPTMVSKGAGVTFNNSMSPTIVVNGVSNVNQFMRELQKNKQFESMMQDMTVNLMNGGNTLAKLKYKY